MKISDIESTPSNYGIHIDNLILEKEAIIWLLNNSIANKIHKLFILKTIVKEYGDLLLFNTTGFSYVNNQYISMIKSINKKRFIRIFKFSCKKKKKEMLDCMFCKLDDTVYLPWGYIFEHCEDFITDTDRDDIRKELVSIIKKH